MPAVLVTYQDEWPACEAITVPHQIQDLHQQTEELIQLELIVPSIWTRLAGKLRQSLALFGLNG